MNPKPANQPHKEIAVTSHPDPKPPAIPIINMPGLDPPPKMLIIHDDPAKMHKDKITTRCDDIERPVAYYKHIPLYAPRAER